jgi:hypothetical protein
MMAGAQIMLTHGQSDGKPGLSIDDVVYSYYGDMRVKLEISTAPSVIANPLITSNLVRLGNAGMLV